MNFQSTFQYEKQKGYLVFKSPITKLCSKNATYKKRYFEFIKIMKQERYYIKRYFEFIKMMRQERYYVKRRRHEGVLRSSVLAGRSHF